MPYVYKNKSIYDLNMITLFHMKLFMDIRYALCLQEYVNL